MWIIGGSEGYGRLRIISSTVVQTSNCPKISLSIIEKHTNQLEKMVVGTEEAKRGGRLTWEVEEPQGCSRWLSDSPPSSPGLLLCLTLITSWH